MKTPFINLKNIKVDLIDKKYNFNELYKNNSTNSKTNVSSIGKTKLSDIKIQDDNNMFSYIDESKKKHLCVFTMKDSLINQDLSKVTNIKCFWCRHSFNTIPLGAPIEYIPSKLYKNYLNELTKTNYLFNESISANSIHSSFGKSNNINHQLEKESLNYYLSDGVFCSFNCTKSYIISNKSDHLYSNSIHLLNKIYIDLFPEVQSPPNIAPAPHWRLLKDYGGHLSIEEFRQSFFNIIFSNVDTQAITKIPSFRSLGYIFEKKIKI